MLWGGWGERKRERAGHDGKGEERREAPAVSLFPSSPARFLFFRLFYFDGDTQREPLRRREPFTLKLMILSLLELLHFLKQIISFVWFKISFRVSRQSIPSQSLLSSSLNNDRTLKMLLCLASVIFRPQIEIK